jgi:hypothetical protein
LFCGPKTAPTATQTANSSATIAAVHRVVGASITAASFAGSGRPGLAGSKRGRRHASATTAKVNVSAHAAPISA